MAQRKRNIVIESYGHGQKFVVWADLKAPHYFSIEGVVEVSPIQDDQSRFVIYDPRYDIEDIKTELEELADKLAADVLDNFTEHPVSCEGDEEQVIVGLG